MIKWFQVAIFTDYDFTIKSGKIVHKKGKMHTDLPQRVTLPHHPSHTWLALRDK